MCSTFFSCTSFAGAVLLAMTLAPKSGHAQPAEANTVQLYGIVDAGLRLDRSTPGSALSVSSGMANGSRWGVRVREQLDGGLRVSANLEGGFLSDSGVPAQGGRAFGRRSIVGIGGEWGELELGRQLTPYWRVNAGTDAFDGLMIGNPSSNAFIRSNTAYVRADNGIWYTSPKLGPVTVQLMHAFGESTSAGVASSAGSISSGSVVWSEGPTSLQYAYLGQHGSANLNKIQAANETLHMLGGTFEIDKSIKLFAGLGTAKRAAGTGSGSLPPVNHKSMQVGITWSSASHRVLIGYGSLKDQVVPDSDSAVLGVGYHYLLSKRTMLYAGWGKRKNDAGARYLLLDAATNGTLTNANVPSGADPSAYTFGVRHSF